MAAVVSLRRVTKTYPAAPPLTVVRDVSLDVTPGETVAIVGPSGSGKSTLLSMMGAIEPPTSGSVALAGAQLEAISEADKARLRSDVIGFVFQQFHLLPGLSALENVALGMLYQGIPRAVRRRRAAEALDRVGLAARSHHRPVELSGGEQQRVAIARAVAGDPQVVLADEPTGALDQAAGSGVIDALLEVAREGTAVVMITHDVQVAGRFGRRVELLDGQVRRDTGRETR